MGASERIVRLLTVTYHVIVQVWYVVSAVLVVPIVVINGLAKVYTVCERTIAGAPDTSRPVRYLRITAFLFSLILLALGVYLTVKRYEQPVSYTYSDEL